MSWCEAGDLCQVATKDDHCDDDEDKGNDDYVNNEYVYDHTDDESDEVEVMCCLETCVKKRPMRYRKVPITRKIGILIFPYK